MHLIPTELGAALPRDLWTLTAEELEGLAVALMGANPAGWVRRNNAVTIAGRHQPPDAKTLPAALADLGQRAQQILTPGGRGAGLRAAAYWHLRFESLHPLRDGNGRVGRLLLAAQCEAATQQPRAQLLAALHEHENEYKWVFVPDAQAERFELLLDLIARITATPLPEEAQRLPLPLEPLPPAKKSPRPAMQRAPSRGAPARRSSFF